MSGPRFTPHLRSKSHDTWSLRFGLLFSYPGMSGCYFYDRTPHRIEPLSEEIRNLRKTRSN